MVTRNWCGFIRSVGVVTYSMCLMFIEIQCHGAKIRSTSFYVKLRLGSEERKALTGRYPYAITSEIFMLSIS